MDRLRTTQPNRAFVEAAGVRTELTAADGELIKLALLERLERSSIEDKDQLLLDTRKVTPSISSGTMRIGIWLLQNEGDALLIVYRGPFGKRSARTYTARVTKSGDRWNVGELEDGEILLR